MNPSPSPFAGLQGICLADITLRAPFAHLFRPLTEAEFSILRASIEAHGILAPVLLDWQWNIVDGFHRLLIASRLGWELDDVPFVWVESLLNDPEEERLLQPVPGPDESGEIILLVPDEVKRAVALACNPTRRITSLVEAREGQHAQRAARIRRVVAHRAAGLSLRAIAELEHVSLGQVQRDVDSAGNIGLDADHPNLNMADQDQPNPVLPPPWLAGGNQDRIPFLPAPDVAAEDPLHGENAEAADARRCDELSGACLALGTVRAALADACAGGPQLRDRNWLLEMWAAWDRALAALVALAPPPGEHSPQQAHLNWILALLAEGRHLQIIGRELVRMSRTPGQYNDRAVTARALAAVAQILRTLRRVRPALDA